MNEHKDKFILFSVDELALKKYKYICKKKRITMSAQLREFVNRKIVEHEKVNGVIEFSEGNTG